MNEKAPVSKLKDNDQQKIAIKIADSLIKAKNPLVISGINCGNEDLLNAALNIANSLRSFNSNVMLSIVLPECNSMGLALIPGKSLDEALELINNEEIETVVILENDLYRRANEKDVDNLFSHARQVIVIDHLENKTSLKQI